VTAKASSTGYVSNIYKYYVAHRLIVDAQVERERAKQATTGP